MTDQEILEAAEFNLKAAAANKNEKTVTALATASIAASLLVIARNLSK